MIIAYAKTSLSLLARRKKLTRREWAEAYIQVAERAVKSKAPQDAYDKSPRVKGQKIGSVRLLEIERDRPTNLIPDEDWEKEGFSLMQALGIPIEKALPEALWRAWKRDEDLCVTIAHFELLDITPYGETLMAEAVRMYGPDWMKAESPVPEPIFSRSEKPYA